MNEIFDFIQINPLGAGGIAVGFLAVLFLLSRLRRSGTVDMSDPRRLYRDGGAGPGNAQPRKKAKTSRFSEEEPQAGQEDVQPPRKAKSGLFGKFDFIDWVAKGNLDEMEALLADGADINLQDENGNTALLLAAFDGQVEAVKLLLDKSADMEIRNDRKDTALMMAAFGGSVEVAGMFIGRGAPVDSLDEIGGTPLFQAIARKGSPEMIEFLINKGCDPNVQMNDGFTVLMIAVAVGDEKSVEVLLKMGADPSKKEGDGRTALDFARISDPLNENIVRMLEAATAK